MKITSELLKMVVDVDVVIPSVDGLGVADVTSCASMLTFIDDEKYIGTVNSSDCIVAVFVKSQTAEKIRDGITKIIVEDPRWCFFSLVNYVARSKERDVTVISPEASVAENVSIAKRGVVIEAGVIVEPGVTIMEDVIIKSGATIRAGATLGVDGFEHKRTTKGLLSVAHDGVVIIEEGAEVGPNSAVIKGFSYRNTIVGRDTKLDALVHYAHGVQSGSRCLIAASAMIGGHVNIGNDVWIGPGACISNRIQIEDNAFVTLGSVVVRDVAAGNKVTGNFAVPHVQFIRNLKKMVE